MPGLSPTGDAGRRVRRRATDDDTRRRGKQPSQTAGLRGAAQVAGFRLDPAARLVGLKITVVVAFCLGLLLSVHLWIGPRSYPTTPILGALPALDGIAAQILFAALMALAVAILAAPRPRVFIVAFVAIVAVFCAFDQTRWQPWAFQYGFLLVVLAAFSWDRDDVAGRDRTLNIARLVVVCTYVFSGLQKLNANFIDTEFPWIVEPVTRLIPWLSEPLRLAGIAVPFVQVGFGIGLMTQRFRRVALIVAVAMHVFILAMFGPAGHDWNEAVWPWTTAMAVFDILLFAGADDVAPRDILWTQRSLVHAAALALFAAAPLLSFVNVWDSYLSAALYSGNVTEAQIYTTDTARAALPAAIARYLVHTSPDTNVINLQRWAFEDLHVAPYPETRVFKSIAHSVCDLLPDRSLLVLIVKEQRMFFSRPETGYRCWQL
jgi:hypothetical protein